jgi:hypothetical protein
VGGGLTQRLAAFPLCGDAPFLSKGLSAEAARLRDRDEGYAPAHSL